MINYNGNLQDTTATISNSNRSFLYGDGVFETLKIINNTVLFLEDHYFRLMASMRIVRMEIPNNFTMEFFESEVLNLVRAMQIENSARIRFTVFRNDGGFYLPNTRDASYLIQAFPLEQTLYVHYENQYEVDLYKDCYIAKQLLSTLKTTNKMLQVMGSIYAQENGLQNCLLLNTDKNVVEALNGNLFLKTSNKLITPPLSEGCLNGIMRKQVLQLATKLENLEILEEPISPFDLQKADELFITNIILGIVSISKYRKKEFDTKTAVIITGLLNESLS